MTNDVANDMEAPPKTIEDLLGISSETVMRGFAAQHPIGCQSSTDDEHEPIRAQTE